MTRTVWSTNRFMGRSGFPYRRSLGLVGRNHCQDGSDIDGVLFSLVRIDPVDETPYTALIVFDPNGSVQTLNAEDCTLVG